MDLLQKIVLRFALTMTIFYECCFAYWLFTKPSASLVIALVMHVILVLCFVYFLYRLSEQLNKPNESLIYTAFVLTLVLPVYGMVGMTCLFILTNLIKIESFSFLDNDEIFLPSKHKMHLRNHNRKPWQIEKDELDVSYRGIIEGGSGCRRFHYRCRTREVKAGRRRAAVCGRGSRGSVETETGPTAPLNCPPLDTAPLDTRPHPGHGSLRKPIGATQRIHCMEHGAGLYPEHRAKRGVERYP